MAPMFCLVLVCLVVMMMACVIAGRENDADAVFALILIVIVLFMLVGFRFG